MIEMTDCKHFDYYKIEKTKENKEIEITPSCLIGIGGINGCPKYCPAYEPK